MHPRPGIFLPAILLLSLCAAAGDAPPAAAPIAPAPAEVEADALLGAGLPRWDAETLGKLAGAISGLPEATASQALWQAASSPLRSDAVQVFLAALASPSPAVRRQAADIMAGLESPDAIDLLLEKLPGLDPDGETLRHVVLGIAAKPNRVAVRGLMRVMLSPNLDGVTAAAAAAQLRRLTRTSLPDRPDSWRDWWRANSRQYE